MPDATPPIRLFWASLYWREGGNAYGYSTHNKMLMEAVQRRGDVILTPDAKVSFALTTSDQYERIPGMFNFLYSMFETDSLPKTFQRGLPHADHIIVPCTHNKWLFGKYTDKPISVCWEGVDIDFYTYKPRQYLGFRPFRYLWLNAPNVRKGWECLIAGWKPFHEANMRFLAEQKRTLTLNPKPLFELYIKTTVTEKMETSHPGIIFNSRNVSRPELLQIYHDAHCFVMPTMGEGFGLTLAEAMSTGLPCVATSVTGTKDFFDNEVGYVIDAEKRDIEVKGEMHGVYVPDPVSMIHQMEQCFYDYQTGKAQRKAKKAAERIRKDFTWDISANSLIEIIRTGVPDEAMLYQNAAGVIPEYSDTTVAGDPSPEHVTDSTPAARIE